MIPVGQKLPNQWLEMSLLAWARPLKDRDPSRAKAFGAPADPNSAATESWGQVRCLTEISTRESCRRSISLPVAFLTQE